MSKFLMCVVAGLLALTLSGSDAQARGHSGGHHSSGSHVSHHSTNASNRSHKKLTKKHQKTKKLTTKNGKKQNLKKKHKKHHHRRHRKKKDGSDGDDDGDGGDDDSGADAGDAGDAGGADAGSDAGADSGADAGDAGDSGSAANDDGDSGPVTGDEEDEADAPATAELGQGDPVLLNVRVPADATVWIDNNPTEQTGTDRQFVTPALTPGKYYSYNLRARWMKDGKPMDHLRHVTVRAGDRLTVDFVTPAQDDVVPPVMSRIEGMGGAAQ